LCPSCCDSASMRASARPFSVSMAEGSRRFPPPWRADKMPGGYVVRDANRHPRHRNE
jgi:hypothetical protein